MSNSSQEVVYIMKKPIGQHLEEVEAEIDRITGNIEYSTDNSNQYQQINSFYEFSSSQLRIQYFNPFVHSPLFSSWEAERFRQKKLEDPLINERNIFSGKNLEAPVEKPVYLPIQKIVQVEKIIEIQKIVEVPMKKPSESQRFEPTIIEIQKIIEVPVERIIEIEKIVEVQKIVEKFVYPLQGKQAQPLFPQTCQNKKFSTEKIIQIPIQKVIQVPVEKQKIIEIQKKVYIPVDRIIEKLVEKVIEVPVQKTVQVEKIIEVVIPLLIQKYIEIPLLVEKTDIQQNPELEEAVEKLQTRKEEEKNNLISQPIEVEELDVIKKAPQINQKILLEGQKQAKFPFQKITQKQVTFIDIPIELERQVIVQIPIEVQKLIEVPIEVQKFVYQQPKQKVFLKKSIDLFIPHFQDFETISDVEGQYQFNFLCSDPEFLSRIEFFKTQSKEAQRVFLEKRFNYIGNTLQLCLTESQKEKQISGFQTLFKKMENQYQKMKQEKFKYEKDCQILGQQLKKTQKRNSELFDQNHSENKNFIILLKKYEQLKENNTVLQRFILKKHQEEESLNQKYRSLEIYSQMMNKSLEESNQLIEELKEKFNDSLDEKNHVLVEKESLKESLTKQIEILQKTIEQDRFSLIEIKMKIQCLNSENQLLQKEKDYLKSKLDESLIKIQRLQKDLLSQKKEINQEDPLQSFSSLPSRTNSQFDDSSYSLQTEKDNNDRKTNVERQTILKDLKNMLKSEIVNQSILSQLFNTIDKLILEVQHRQRANCYLNQTVFNLQEKLNTLETISTFISLEGDKTQEVQYTKSIQRALIKSQKLFQKQQKEKYELLYENEHLQQNIYQMKYNFAAENLIQQLKSQLQKEKKINLNLQKRIAQQNQEMLKYECDLFDKAEKINQLKLLFTKKTGEKQNIPCLNSVFEGQTVELKNLTMQVNELKIKNRNYEMQSLQFRKQKNSLENDLKMLKKHQKDHTRPHNIKAINKEEDLYAVYPFNKFISANKITDKTKYIMIIKLIEFFQNDQIGEEISDISLEPQNIFLVGNIAHQVGLVLQINKPNKNRKHTFMAPEELSSSPCESTVVWNLALLIDYIIHGVSYFASLEQIANYQGYYNMKLPSKKWQKMKSVLSEMLHQSPSIRPSFEVCTQQLLETLSQSAW